nr:MAG TPA: hypothetical protein [Bacteriophage sp.]
MHLVIFFFLFLNSFLYFIFKVSKTFSCKSFKYNICTN